MPYTDSLPLGAIERAVVVAVVVVVVVAAAAAAAVVVVVVVFVVVVVSDSFVDCLQFRLSPIPGV